MAKEKGFQRFAFFPSAKGVDRQFPFVGEGDSPTRSAESPYNPGPPMSDSGGFKLTPNLLHLAPGVTALETTTFGNAGDYPKLLDSSNLGGNNDVIVAGRLASSGATTLHYMPVSTNTLSASLGTVEPATADYAGLGKEWFSDHLLITSRTNGLWWYDGTTRTARKAGWASLPSAPTLATGAAGVLTGNYYGKVTFVNDRGHESNGGTASAVVAPAGQKISWTNIPTGPTGTSKRRLYRTVAGGTSYLYLTEIADNTTTTYTDNTADSGLGSELSELNTSPTDTIQAITASPTRVCLLSTDGKTVYFSNIDAATAVPQWESFPSSLSLEIPFGVNVSGGQTVVFFEDDIYVFGNNDTFRIIGDIATGVKVEKVFPGLGIHSPKAYCRVPGQGLFIVSQHRKVMRIAGGQLTEIGQAIQQELSAWAYTPSTDYGLAIEYDPQHDELVIGGVSTGSPGGNTYSFKTQQWMAEVSGRAYTIMHYSSAFRNFYGWTVNGNGYAINAWFSGFPGTLSYTNGAVVTYGAYIQYYPWTPLPGFDIDFGWIEILISAKPLVSGMVPMLKVQYAFDGSNTFTTKYADFSSNYITRQAAGTVVRALRIPVHKVGRTLQVKISPSTGTASYTNGVEIFGINVWAMPLREAGGAQNVQFA